ncbi:MAG: alpha/beta fold hydrolase [Nitrospirae bacterium]|nr:alpha/beta fold hydrolase [Nitrospirota bacterium]
MTRREILIGGLSIRYHDAGEGPPVVFVHGAGATARLWHRQLGALSKSFRVLAPDLPGFGGSGRSPDIKGVRDYAGFLARFMDALGLKRASLVGSSMGGWAACWFAREFPERLDRLVLISPAGLYLPDDPPMPVSGVIEELRRAYSGPAEAPAASGVRPNDELLNGIDTLLCLENAGGFTPDLGGRLSGITARTLIVWGSEDRVIPVSYADEFARRIPGSRLAVLDGAGHLPYIDSPESVTGLLAGFLAPPPPDPPA